MRNGLYYRPIIIICKNSMIEIRRERLYLSLPLSLVSVLKIDLFLLLNFGNLTRLLVNLLQPVQLNCVASLLCLFLSVTFVTSVLTTPVATFKPYVSQVYHSAGSLGEVSKPQHNCNREDSLVSVEPASNKGMMALFSEFLDFHFCQSVVSSPQPSDFASVESCFALVLSHSFNSAGTNLPTSYPSSLSWTHPSNFRWVATVITHMPVWLAIIQPTQVEQLTCSPLPAWLAPIQSTLVI